MQRIAVKDVWDSDHLKWKPRSLDFGGYFVAEGDKGIAMAIQDDEIPVHFN
jgi:hypothetical protein